MTEHTNSRYFGDWSDHEGMVADFSPWTYSAEGRTPPPGIAADAEVLFAVYTYEDYSGDAFVLFERDGVLFEVIGSHCSCYGLEDQWEPSETTWAAVRGYTMFAEPKPGEGSWSGSRYPAEARQAWRDLVATRGAA